MYIKGAPHLLHPFAFDAAGVKKQAGIRYSKKQAGTRYSTVTDFAKFLG